MTVIERIRRDSMNARKEKSGQKKVSLFLTTLISEIDMVGKNQGNRATTEREALDVIKKFRKSADQTLESLKKAGRETGDIQKEIEILNEYMPAAIPEAEVEQTVRSYFSELSDATSKEKRSSVMKALRDKYGVAFDGKVMSAVVNRVLEEE